MGPILYERMRFSDLDEVLEFNRASFPGHARNSDRYYWEWHFLKNPSHCGSEIPVWLARCDGSIVGQLPTQPIELNIDGVTVAAAWYVDIVVAPEFRRHGVMRGLFDAVNEVYKYGLGLATGVTSKMVRNFGWCVFSSVPRYSKLLFPGEAVRDLTKFAPVRAAANALFRPMRRTTKGSAGLMVSQLADFDDDFDGLCDRARGQWTCSVSRSTATLRWLYKDQPGKRFAIWGCYDGDALCGYAVTYTRKPNSYGSVEKMAISDLVYDPSRPKTTVDALIGHIIDRGIEGRVGSIVTDVMDPMLTQRLKAFGFVEVKSDLEIMTNGHEHRELLCDATNWFLTRGDADITLFEPPNIS